MKLQLALDSFSNIEGAKSILAEVIDLVDIIEVGTPFILQEGIKVVEQMKKAYPDTIVLADLKIIDAGALEARLAFDAGSDIVTLLGVAHDTTIRNALDEARKSSKQVMVDFISVGDVRRRTLEMEAMGVGYICVHSAHDVHKSENPLEDLHIVQSVSETAKIAVAGGINPETLSQLAPYRPDIVIVGSYITGSQNRRRAALEIRQMLA
jgi:3-hexulose-6-phosphate synthase